VRRADDRPLLGKARIGHQPRLAIDVHALADTEVHQADAQEAFVARLQDDVRRLDVAVHDTSLFDRLDGEQKVVGDLHGHIERQRALREHVLERASGHPLHHHVGRAVRQLTDVVDAWDMRIFEAGADVRFAPQPGVRALHILLGDVDHLERDRRAEARVQRLIDDGRATLAKDAPNDQVVADTCPGR
jgi:hypothetical protein